MSFLGFKIYICYLQIQVMKIKVVWLQIVALENCKDKSTEIAFIINLFSPNSFSLYLS